MLILFHAYFSINEIRIAHISIPRPLRHPGPIRQRSAIFAVLLTVLASPLLHAQGWDKAKPLAPSVIVDLGAPQVYTMEQAHYLLERNRARDLGLLELDPSPLNPNDTVGIRASALQTLFSGSVSFNPAIPAQNSVAMSQYNAQMQAYNLALSQRTSTITQQTAVNAALLAAQQQLLALQTANPQNAAAIAEQTTTISTLTAQNTALTTQISAALPTAPTAPTITAGSAQEETTATALGTNPDFENLVKGFNPGTGASKLSASVQLDNYIDFQYEMVAKQLTLLQDQAGPDSRVLFLELPHSIYVTDKLHLYPYAGGLWGDHLVQSWWTIGGALQIKPLNRWTIDSGAHRPPTLIEAIELNRKFPDFATAGYTNLVPKKRHQLLDTHTGALEHIEEEFHAKDCALQNQIDALQKLQTKSPPGCNCETVPKTLTPTVAELEKARKNLKTAHDKAIQDENTDYQEDIDILNSQPSNYSQSALAAFFYYYKPSYLHAPKTMNSADSTDKSATAFSTNKPTFGAGNFNLLAINSNVLSATATTSTLTTDQSNFAAWASYWLYGAIGLETGIPGSDTAPIYALDLIPRQSSLNVADATTSTHMAGFAGVFGWLSGLGARARYERQKQEFSQFTQVETYATAFGKGDYTFGWTFGPNPGTKQIAAGLRTTYAVVVVPKDTRIVRLNAIGCGYRRRDVPRNPFSPNSPEVQLDSSSGLLTLEPGTGKQQQNKFDSEDCGTLHTFDIEVPDSNDDFWIEDADYTPVPAGQRVTLKLSGRYGDTVGVLVNGTPLQKVPSITQPMLTPAGYAVPTNAGDAGTQGVFEIVHTRSAETDEVGSDIVASFIMPPTFLGSPNIEIVSAARDMLVNEAVKPHPPANTTEREPHLLDKAMFYALPAITRVDPDYRPSGYDPKKNLIVGAKIVGHGFDTRETSSLIFGSKPLQLVTDNSPLSAGQYRVLPGGSIIDAVVLRTDNFPTWSIDYTSIINGQQYDATFSRDDSTGPAILDPCTKKNVVLGTTTSGKTPLTLTVTGNFFSGTVTPTIALSPSSSADPAPTPTSTLKSQTEWDINVTVPSATANVTVSLIPTIKSYKSDTAPPCPLPQKPASKPQAKKPK